MTESTEERTRASEKRSWAGGGPAMRRWDWLQLGWAVFALGLGLIASRLVGVAIPGATGSWVGQIVLWAILVAAVVWALRRGVPRGLLTFRPADVLYGLVIGVALRIVQGLLFVATGGPAGFPSMTSLAGGPSAAEWAVEVATAGVVGPVVEEFFFRGLVLVTVFSAVRRMLGSGVGAERIAGVIAVVAASGLFVLAHLFGPAQALGDLVALSLVGLVAGTVVVLTRRIWGAVLVHVVYNTMYVGLLFVGTVLG